MPSQLHNSGPDTFVAHVPVWAHNNGVHGKVHVKPGHQITGYMNAEGEAFSRIPDLTIMIPDSQDVLQPRIVIESGFTQSKDDLAEAVLDHLRHKDEHIKYVVKISLQEKDPYTTPFQCVDDENNKAKYDALANHRNTTANMFTVDDSDPTKGVTYEGYTVINPFDAWIEL